MSKTHIQGSIDAFCGIYCLVHFLEHVPNVTRRRPKAQAVFHSLLVSAEEEKLLTADRIALAEDGKIDCGYYSHDLIKIFNCTSQRKRLPYKAFELEDVSEAHPDLSRSDMLAAIFADGGSAILQVFGESHWVLAHKLGDNGAIVVKDSGHEVKYRKDELKRIPASFVGVAILPSRSNISKVMKNA